MRRFGLVPLGWLLLAGCALAQDAGRNPAVEAIDLVAATQAEAIRAAERGDWWMDTARRQWTVQRQAAPGILDTRYQLLVVYSINDRRALSWAVDLKARTVKAIAR